MAFSLICYSESQDTSGALSNVAAVTDPHVRVIGDDVIVPNELNYLAAAYAVGASLTRAAVVSPSIRRRYPFEVTPLDANANPSSLFVFTPFTSPIQLDEAEALNFQVAENGAGAVRDSGFVWLSDGPFVPVTGSEVFTIRATGSTTLSTYAWTNCALTFNDTLPAGEYAVVGMQATSAGALAARLVFTGSSWRPGVVATTSSTVVGNPLFRYGNMGVFGTFAHNTPPTVDFFSSSADTSETVYLDLVMVTGRLSGMGRS
ncbi:MAG: hypothetical protein EB092_09385 [Chitinophagia bacterium]|nr:hypothetical protein [Chitinophagia bacterium]